MRVYEQLQSKFGDKYRFINYTQRYFGKDDWPDKGGNFGVPTFGKDAISFLKAINVGPANLVGWSYGGAIAIEADLQDPSLIKSMVLYEPTVRQLIDEYESTKEGKAARESQGQIFGQVGPAVEAGDSVKAAKLLIEGVFKMKPGGWEGQADALKTMQLDNARTVPAMWDELKWDITCDKLKKINTPTLIIRGENTPFFFKYIADCTHLCIPSSKLIVMTETGHEGPVSKQDEFVKMITEFISATH